ncbi:f0ef33f1-9d1a-4983-8101-d9ba0d9569e1 [Thermothielavioides terrestris]|uniref:F0ef33f1-9d1a-4983-8101-d9ba0d9569e1 n=1 Tax=Thermothielavioides terrestris TaxID=2587410 RepID=A0A446BLY8_9PEZI|nr:f0ef33f1-9d1a-4983-8101-d9ba0d9569e1 [Thermothielavioides terrestris]
MPRFVQVLPAIALAPSAFGATLIASHFSGGVYTLSLAGTNTSGTLSITSQTTGCGATPAWIQYYGDTRKLYCFDETWNPPGVLAEYSVGSDGRLNLTGKAKTAGNTVYGRLYGGADGRGFVATAEYTPSTVTTYKMPLSGNSALQTLKFTMAQRGPNPRQDVPHPHEVQVDPTGQYILTPDLGADLVRIFKIDANSGNLTACSEGKADPGDGPRHIEFWKSSSGLQKAYTVNELGNSVSAWDVTYPSDASGCLSLNKTQTLSTYAPGKKGGPTTKAAELRLVGNFLYATNRADETFGSQQDSIAIYTIDPTTGAITWLEAANSYSYYPRTFQFNKDGTLLAVGGQTSSNVAIVARDPATGKLGKLVANIQVGQKGEAGQEDGLSAVVWVE